LPEHSKSGSYQDVRGFSLLELMVTMAILIVVLLAAFEVIIMQRKTFKAEQEMINTTQSARASQDILLRELRISGYKVLEADFLGSLSRWISDEYLPTYPKNVSLSSCNCPIITQGDNSGPDMITLFMADSKENALAVHVASDCNTIVLDPNAPGFSGSDKFRVNDIIRIGDHTDFAKVMAVSDNSLTIDTNPSVTGNQGLAHSYNAGVPLREINIITYTVMNEENDPRHLHHTAGHPVLKRKLNEAEYMDVAEDVEDLQIISGAATFPNYKLQLITRTSTKGNYVSGCPDGYKRIELLADFRLRNFIKANCLPPTVPTISSVTGLGSSSPCTIHVNWSAVTQNIASNTLSSECSVSEYIVAYDTTPATRAYAFYPENNTSCDIDISDIKDPNHPTFYISVAAVNTGGLGAFSAERTITDTSPPAAIGNLNAVADNLTITLMWTHNPECDVVAYRIYRSTGSGGPYTQIHSDPNIRTGPSMPYAYTFHDTNLPCNTYYYVVRAYDNKFESANSPEAHASITDSDPPAEPAHFSYTIAAGNIATFNWTLSPDDPAMSQESQGDNDVCGYHIYALNGESQILLNSSPVPAGQSTINLNSQGYSNFGIKAIDSCGNFSNLVTQSVSCQNPPVIAFSNPSSGAQVSGSITINGTASSSNSLVWVNVKIDDGQWLLASGTSTWSYPWDTSHLTNSAHTISVKTLDSESCSGNASLSVTVQNEIQGADTTPPSFGNILQIPGSNPIEADQSVQICIRVSDPSGISSAILNTNLGESFSMTDADMDDVYCAQIPPHNGSTVNYSITARDNYQNPSTASSSYCQSAAIPVDHDPPVISPVTFRITESTPSNRTIQFTTTITDASGIATATFTYSGNGMSGSDTLTNSEGNTYIGSYTRNKNQACTVTITAIDSDSPSPNTATYTVSDGGIN